MGNLRNRRRKKFKSNLRHLNDPEIKKEYTLKALATKAKKKLENDKKAKEALKENINEEKSQSEEILGRGKRRRFVTDYKELSGANPFPKRRTNRKKNETVVEMEMAESEEPNNQYDEIKIEVNEDDEEIKKEVDEDFNDVKVELFEE